MSIDTDGILQRATENIMSESDTLHELNTAAQEIAWQENVSKNKFALPKALPSFVVMNAEFLQQFKDADNFQLFSVKEDFFPIEKRHIAAGSGDLVCGLSELEGWVCGFKNTDPDSYGFIPKSILNFEKMITPSATRRTLTVE